LIPLEPRVVTFDCWSTLIYEVDPNQAREIRADAISHAARRLGIDSSPEQAVRALDAGWQKHWDLWHKGIASGASEIGRWALEALGANNPADDRELTVTLSEASLQEDIRPLEGARVTLERLEAEGIRRALICDTGFSPGSIVRRLLAEAGLLELLEVQIFSDEAGVPKPDPHVFRLALEGLECSTEASVHVGDRRRSDVAGARAYGMGSIRIRWHYDDVSDHPDADAVAESHEHLLHLLSLEPG
jgi:putative hydrolase of the HAD superfamily